MNFTVIAVFPQPGLPTITISIFLVFFVAVAFCFVRLVLLLPILLLLLLTTAAAVADAANDGGPRGELLLRFLETALLLLLLVAVAAARMLDGTEMMLIVDVRSLCILAEKLKKNEQQATFAPSSN